MKIFNNLSFHDIITEQNRLDFLYKKAEDLWKKTPYENYSLISQTAKGQYGESLIKDICKKHFNFNIENRINVEHDCIINNIKTELKFCLTETKRPKFNFPYIKENTFNISHLNLEYDWERSIIFCICVNQKYLGWFSKEDMQKLVSENLYFSKIKNNTYNLHGKNVINFFNSDYCRSLYEW